MKSSPILTIAIVITAASAINAQTWDGGSAVDSNFNTANNWNPNAVPANNGTANLIFAGIVRLTPVVNVNFDVNGVTFNNTAGAFSIGASGGSMLQVHGGGFTNNDADAQAISVPVTFTSGSSITATSGNLTFINQMNIGSNAVTVSGGFDTNLASIVGTGSFVKNGTGALSISPVGNQNYGLTINAGTVEYLVSATFVAPAAVISVAGGTFAPLSNLTVSTGATLDVASTATFSFPVSRTMTVQSGSAATFESSLTTAANSTYRVTGGTSTFSTGGLAVRDGGEVEVLAGGTFSTTAGSLVVGQAATSGSILVDGAGSSFTNDPGASASIGSGAGSTGTLTFNNGGTGSFASTSLFLGGTGGSGTLIVKNGAEVTAGTFEVAQSTSSGTANVLVTGPGSKLITIFTVSDFSIGATSGSTGTVTVANGGELDLAGPLTINETGTLTLNGGIVSIGGGEAFTNNGTLNFNSGRFEVGFNLNIGGGTSPLGTNITLQPGKEIEVFAPRTTTVGTAGALVLDGGLLSTGSLIKSGGGTIDFRRGTLRITGNVGLTIGSGGPLGANVTLPIGATLDLLNPGGTTTVSSSAVLTVDGGSFSTGFLTNNGSVLIKSGTASNFNGGNNASGAQLYVEGNFAISNFTNDSGGRIELGGSGRINSGTLTNNGLITGSGTIATTMANGTTGKIRVDFGKTLSFTGSFFFGNSGEFNLQGGTLDLALPITNNASGFITGRGALYTGGLTNSGQMAFSGGTMDIHGDTTLTAGARVVTSGAGTVTTFFDDVTHNGLEIFTGANASTVFFGAQSGAGPFTGTGTVYFIGDLRPGNSPASVLYEGDLVLGGAATLTIELGGLALGSQYDHLDVGGTFSTDGTLDVLLYDGFTPHFGDTFDLFDAGNVAGHFDDVNLPVLGGGLEWDATNLPTTGQLRVVPEPGIDALLASALTLVGFHRRRNTQPEPSGARQAAAGSPRGAAEAASKPETHR